jgi:purine nucleoside phosphorylase
MSVAATVELICDRVGHRLPKLAIVVSTGLQAVDGDIDDPATFAYGELPGFPKSAVTSHLGRLLVGKLAGRSVALLESHEDYYREGRIDAMRLPLEVVAGLGCDKVLVTAPAHSLHPELGPGRLALIDRQRVLGDPNRLAAGLGARYPVDPQAAYDPVLREKLCAAAARAEIPLAAGCFGWLANGMAPIDGREAGCDMVGRSLIPEAVLARAAGLRVAALAHIVDWAPGAAPAGVSPDLARQRADFGAVNLRRLRAEFLAQGGAD